MDNTDRSVTDLFSILNATNQETAALRMERLHLESEDQKYLAVKDAMRNGHAMKNWLLLVSVFICEDTGQARKLWPRWEQTVLSV